MVLSEVLKFRRGSRGQPWHFLDFARGKGTAIVNEDSYGDEHTQAVREEQALESADILAIKGLGQFQRFRVASDFRKLIESDLKAVGNAFARPELARQQEKRKYREPDGLGSPSNELMKLVPYRKLQGSTMLGKHLGCAVAIQSTRLSYSKI